MKNEHREFRIVTTRDDSPMPAGHIHFLRINAFAREGINFTDKESAHFDVCRPCRLKVIDALRDLEPLEVRTIMMPKAA
jgi:hypothetical protein